jgi:hypothetical protein
MPSFVYFVILLGISLAATLALRVLLLRTGRQLQKRIGFSDAALTECCTDDPTARLRRHLRSGDDLAVALGAQKLLSDWRLATFLNQRQLGFCGPDAGHDPVEIDQRDHLFAARLFLRARVWMEAPALLSRPKPRFDIDAALVKCPEGVLKRCSVQHGPRSLQEEHRSPQGRCVTPTNFVASVAERLQPASGPDVWSGSGARGCARFEHLGGFGRLLNFQSAGTKAWSIRSRPCGRKGLSAGSLARGRV